jgi:hypothetical protein
LEYGKGNDNIFQFWYLKGFAQIEGSGISGSGKWISLVPLEIRQSRGEWE